MPAFAYTALSRDGQRTTGTLSADSRAAAISQVMQKGLQPVSLDEEKGGKGKRAESALPVAGRGRVSAKAIEGFTRELANLLSGGVPLSRALSLLRREASNPNARQLVAEIHGDVVGGKSLADAMARWPKAFSTVYIAMVRAGEQGGFLDVVLQQIADFRTRESDLKGKVRAALVYPATLAVVATLVVIFLLTFFIPKFSVIFKQFGGNLP